MGKLPTIPFRIGVAKAKGMAWKSESRSFLEAQFLSSETDCADHTAVCILSPYKRDHPCPFPHPNSLWAPQHFLWAPFHFHGPSNSNSCSKKGSLTGIPSGHAEACLGLQAVKLQGSRLQGTWEMYCTFHMMDPAGTQGTLKEISNHLHDKHAPSCTVSCSTHEKGHREPVMWRIC